MIGHQAPSYQITERKQVTPHFIQKVLVVFSGEKYLALVVALVVNVEHLVFVELHNFLICFERFILSGMLNVSFLEVKFRGHLK